MKKVWLLILPLLIVLVFKENGICQVQEENRKCDFSEIFILTGGAAGNNTLYDFKDFKKMAPESSLLKEDFTGFKSDVNGELYENTYVSIQLGFVPGKTRRENGKGSPLIRIGIGYESSDYFDVSLSKESSFRYDTLFNSQGQIVYLRDSTQRIIIL
ncbi:MAG: hypothetical protein IPO63_14795 [Bacteroidetes bacterium]|nr:hypothetical protein [Bacteroidota bacterium]